MSNREPLDWKALVKGLTEILCSVSERLSRAGPQDQVEGVGAPIYAGEYVLARSYAAIWRRPRCRCHAAFTHNRAGVAPSEGQTAQRTAEPMASRWWRWTGLARPPRLTPSVPTACSLPALAG